MKTIGTEEVRQWLAEAGGLSLLTRSIGTKRPAGDYLEQNLGVPLHLRFVLEKLAAESDGPLPSDALDSISFYSLCKGLFLPLSFLNPERVGQLFGFRSDPPPDSAGRERLLQQFLAKDLGLSFREKLACVLGDPFMGSRSSFRRDRLLTLLQSVQLASRKEMLDHLTRAGDVAVLFAESRDIRQGDPPLTAAEVLRTLRFLPDERLAARMDILRSLLGRCGRMEAYFLSKLLLRKAGFGFDYQGALIARAVAASFDASEEQVAHAMALTDAFHVAEVLEEEGVEGLRAIQLQPLVPVRPALASGSTDEIDAYPVWVERKYDGIRLMLHKSTDERGAVLCGAYTRNRGDWLEQIPGLDVSIRAIPAQSTIVDGELYGTVLDLDGARPATVYEVYAALQGEPLRPVNLKFAAFDLLYLNGADLTRHPLQNRRQTLMQLFTPLQSYPGPVPFSVSEGQMANTKDDVSRLFHHFRSQGYEGVITKNLDSPYHLAARDPNWRKRKPEVTLDVVLLGATYAVTTKERAGMFGSYVIGMRSAEGDFEIIGDVAGVDQVRDAQIQQEILREGLMTGTRIERPSASGTRAGIELRPAIVVTVKFEGIVKDQVTGKLSLRDPKLAFIRSDKSAFESDRVEQLQELYLRQSVG